MEPVTDRYGNIIGVGDKVKHFDRRDQNCIDLPEYSGVVTSIKEHQLPLINVDCGNGLLRIMPHFDLILIKET